MNPSIRKITFTAVSILVLLLSVHSLWADRIVMKDGTPVYGRITNQSPSALMVTTLEGKELLLSKDRIDRIDFGDAKKQKELEEKRKQLQERLAALRKAREEAERRKEQEEADAQELKNEREQLADLLQEADELQKAVETLEEENRRLAEKRISELEKRFGGMPGESSKTTLRIKTGKLEWQPSVLSNAYAMENSRFLNLAAMGRPETYTIAGPSRTTVSFPDFLAIEMRSFSPMEKDDHLYSLTFARSDLGGMVAGRSSSSSFIFPGLAGGTDHSVTENAVETEFFSKSELMLLDFTYRYQQRPFGLRDNPWIQGISYHLGVSLYGESLASEGFRYRATLSTVSPGNDLISSLINYGAGYASSTLDYGEVVLGVNLGAGYEYSFWKKHQASVRLNFFYGKGGLNYTHTSEGIWEIVGYTLPATAESNGDGRLDVQGLDYELGYSYDMGAFLVGGGYSVKNRSVRVTKTSVDRGWDWYYNMAALLRGDDSGLIFDQLDSLGPFPESEDRRTALEIYVAIPL